METCKWEINHLDNKAIFRPVYVMEDSVNFTALCQRVITPRWATMLIALAATSSAMMTTWVTPLVLFWGPSPGWQDLGARHLPNIWPLESLTSFSVLYYFFFNYLYNHDLKLGQNWIILPNDRLFFNNYSENYCHRTRPKLSFVLWMASYFSSFVIQNLRAYRCPSLKKKIKKNWPKIFLVRRKSSCLDALEGMKNQTVFFFASVNIFLARGISPWSTKIFRWKFPDADSNMS